MPTILTYRNRNPLRLLPALRFTRLEQRSAAEVEHRPVRFGAAVVLEVMVSKDARQFVDRALQRGGARRVVAVGLPALVLRRSDYV
jgi:hypothetical protein